MPFAIPLPRLQYKSSHGATARWQPRSSARAATPCHIAMAVLVLEADARRAHRLVELFASQGIADVDVVTTAEAALRAVGERDYAILVFDPRAHDPAIGELFVRVAVAALGSLPALMLTGAVTATLAAMHPGHVSVRAEGDGQDFGRALRAAVARSDAACRSRGYCNRAICPLDPPE